MTMTWEQEYAMKKAKRAEFVQKHGITPPDAFFGPREAFLITSGAVRVTDPCYSPETWCAGTQQNVLNGVWLGWSRNVHDEWSWDWRIDDLVKADFDPNGETKSYEQIAKDLIGFVTKGLSLEGILLREDFMDQNREYINKYLSDDPHVKIAISSLLLKVLSDRYTEEDLVECFVLSMEDMERWGNVKNPQKIFQALKDKVSSYRQAMITVVHESYKDDPRFSDENILDTVFNHAIKSDIDVGVDSGQAGIFDLDLFLKYAASENHGKDTPEHERFYDVCCNVAADESSYRRNKEERKDIVICSGPVVVDNLSLGYNSSSGEGDGSYTLRYITDAEGKVIMMNIMFLTPEEYYTDEEEDFDEEEEEE